MPWTYQRIVDEINRWRAYDYTDAEILVSLRSRKERQRLLGDCLPEDVDRIITEIEEGKI